MILKCTVVVKLLRIIKPYPIKSAFKSLSPARTAPIVMQSTPILSICATFFRSTNTSLVKINRVVSLRKAKKTGIFTRLRAKIPDITLIRKVTLIIEQDFARARENFGTAQRPGIPRGLKILKVVVKATPNIN